MEYLQRLPFILGAIVAIIIGMINYKCNIGLKDTCVRMAAGMVVFFILGVYIRNNLKRIEKEIQDKKEQEELKLKEQIENQNMEDVITEPKARENAGTSKIDYRIDDNEEFLPLNVEHINKQ